jgi:hypothetical protein
MDIPLMKQKKSWKALPNPLSYYFTISIQSCKNEAIDLRVVDALSRTFEIKKGIAANGTLQLGRKYRLGIYIVEVGQGKQK